MHNDSTSAVTSHGYLLLLEDSAILGKLLLKWFAGTFPEKGVVVVATIAEAQQVVAGVNVDFFLCTSELSDGNAHDFMSDIRTVDPSAPFILMTDSMSDPGLEELKALQPVGILKKPLNLPSARADVAPLPGAAPQGAERSADRAAGDRF